MDIGLISIAKSVWNLIVIIYNIVIKFFPKVWNLLWRPKLDIKLRQREIEFKSPNGTKNNIEYPCLQIFNRTKKKLNFQLKYIQINNEGYQGIIGKDLNFNRLDPDSTRSWIDCDNEVYKEFFYNWRNIAQNGYSISVNPHSELIFPLKFSNSAIYTLSQESKNSSLFFSQCKINVRFRINGKDYEYGLNKKQVYETYLKYLAFRQKVNEGE